MIVAVLSMLITGCEKRDEEVLLSHGEKALLEELAGRLARHWCLPEESTGWRDTPTEEEISALTTICSKHDGAWTYFYRSMSDSANTLEPPGF
jgi:hypothetical protein